MSLTGQVWTANLAIIAKLILRGLRQNHLFRSENRRVHHKLGSVKKSFRGSPL
jgi:hypothetical protein